MKIKVSEASGSVQIDWMVAKCEGNLPLSYDDWVQVWPHYSTDWAQGGPIISREHISIRHWTNVPVVHAYMPDSDWSSDGESALVAAMRCFICSRLGEIVEVPEELCQQQVANTPAYTGNRVASKLGDEVEVPNELV